MTTLTELFFDQIAPEQKSIRSYKVVADPSHEGTIQLIQYWREKDSSGGLVVGRDIPSKAISNILSNLIVYEPISDFADFRVQHAGTRNYAHYHGDVTGKLMSELFDAEAFKYNCAKAKEVLLSHRMMIFEADLSQFGITRRTYEVVLLPVLAPDRSSPWMLCGIFRFD